MDLYVPACMHAGGRFKHSLTMRKYQAEIVKNPDFRSKFNSMCSAIGVDPLASNKVSGLVTACFCISAPTARDSQGAVIEYLV